MNHKLPKVQTQGQGQLWWVFYGYRSSWVKIVPIFIWLMLNILNLAWENNFNSHRTDWLSPHITIWQFSSKILVTISCGTVPWMLSFIPVPIFKKVGTKCKSDLLNEDHKDLRPQLKCSKKPYSALFLLIHEFQVLTLSVDPINSSHHEQIDQKFTFSSKSAQ